MLMSAQREPIRSRRPGAAVAALLPLAALTLACLDGVATLAAGQILAALAGLR